MLLWSKSRQEQRRLEESDCDFKCPGNNKQQCGGRSRLSVYKKRVAANPATPGMAPASKTFSASGYYTDSTGNRALKGAKFVSNDMTIEKCAASCSAWTYFGLEYSSECFCGSQLEQSTQVDTSQCNMPCKGNSAQICGAGNRLNVYKFNSITPTATSAATGSVALFDLP